MYRFQVHQKFSEQSDALVTVLVVAALFWLIAEIPGASSITI